MTKNKIKALTTGNTNDFKKLSIQVGLNGLSFCILDSISQKVLLTETVGFKTEKTPYLVQKSLKEQLEAHKLIGQSFAEVVTVHRNKLFSLVPKDLFDENELANYLKFNTKIMANDHIVFDEVKHQNLVNVYVPYTNINNYLFELFGEFEFKHNATVFLETLLAQKFDFDTHCWVHVLNNSMEVMVVSQKKLILYNQFDFLTKEDFIYFLLFVFEQLKIDVENVKLKLFGQIKEGDDLYHLCYEYIKEVSITKSPVQDGRIDADEKEVNFTLINAL